MRKIATTKEDMPMYNPLFRCIRIVDLLNFVYIQ